MHKTLKLRIFYLLFFIVNGCIVFYAQSNALQQNDLLSTSLTRVFRPELDYTKPDLVRCASFIYENHAKTVGGFQHYSAFFCRIEDKIEKQSQIPFRFRLGSLNYVNMLENKGKHFIFVEDQF